MTDKAETPEEWAIVEIMGHNRTAGRCQEVTRFGAVMLRVDRPHDDGTMTTEFYGGSSIYAYRPCAEALARKAAGQMYENRPIAPLDYRLPAPVADEADEPIEAAPRREWPDIDDDEPF